MKLAEETLFRLSRSLVRKRDQPIIERSGEQIEASQGIAGANTATFDRSVYKEWRNSELRSQFDAHFSPDTVAAKRVLDFGCGSGKLSLYVASLGAASVDGIDLKEESIRFAEKEAEESGVSPKPRYTVGQGSHIPFPGASFDAILCFDVLEHVMSLENILKEWRRVLAPKGRLLAWWQPYFHPYGHHLMAYIPVPWAHVFFSEDTMRSVCNRIAMAPEYAPRFWDLDDAGNRIEEKRPTANLGGVNGLTIRNFEKLCEQHGFRLVRNEAHHFSGPGIVEAVSKYLTRVPVLKEYFTAYMIYELERT